MDKARIISQIENAPEHVVMFLDLGWANGWGPDLQRWPMIIGECKKLGHKPKMYNLDKTLCGRHHEVRCVECGYVYHIYSSD